MTDDPAPLPAELPNPATFNGHMLYRYGRAFQRVQGEDGSWVWVEIHPPPLRKTPAKLP
ncbi:MAG TPA: hypothetical protein VLA19_14720 [Herpetosiphonaceae bacterium]|nr:hypothetical protein [Herpetosiphonaceae bacterium]